MLTQLEFTLAALQGAFIFLVKYIRNSLMYVITFGSRSNPSFRNAAQIKLSIGAERLMEKASD